MADVLFKALEGDNAIVVKGGIFRQADLYTMDGALFAKVGAGFVRLYANGTTSQQGTRLHKLVYDGSLFKDRLGRLTLDPGEGHAEIGVSDTGQLLLSHQ